MTRSRRALRFRPARLVLPLAAAALLGASPAAAQLVRGSVIDNSTFLAVVGAGVTALDSAGKPVASTLSDSLGAFALRLPAPGTYRLRSSALGYRRGGSARVDLAGTAETKVVLRLVPDPVAIDSITVMAQHRVPWLAREGFYRRQAEGWGHFLDEQHIEAKAPFKFTDLLYGMAGIQVVCGMFGLSCDMRTTRGATFIGKACIPTVVLDGYVVRTGGSPSQGSQRLNLDELLDPHNLAGVEVYRGAAGVPVQYAGYMGACGAVIAWSKR